MILGIDVGSFATKRSDGFIFASKVSKQEDILKNNSVLKTDDGVFYIGEGSFITSYRKIDREYYRELFLYSAAYNADKTTFIKAVVGLPRALIADNSVFANSIGFRKVGEMIWQ